MFFSILSAILLALAYPPFNLSYLAWIAFVPLLTALSKAESRGDAFFKSFAAGFVFFLISISWLTQVTGIGYVLAAAFEALFWGLFGMLVFSRVKNIFWIALVWTVTEIFRSWIPVFGFPWNLLAYTQSYNHLILQSANTLGVYGLGFVIMLVNACIWKLGARSKGQGAKRKQKPLLLDPSPLTLSAILVLIFSHGWYHQSHRGQHIGDWRISVIQGNIPQSVKWQLVAREKINEIYSNLTELAGRDKPDFIIWPEAAFPGYFDHDPDARPVKELVRRLQVPLLVGSVTAKEDDRAYNSALLVGTDGEIKAQYDKQILVPFGEYVPFQWLLRGLNAFAETLGVSHFSAGKEKKVFDLLNGEARFSVLICFEDIFPALARDFVQRGAQFLVVITNDAWFGRFGAAQQHLQASIFRAVENGVPVVRAANTGISAFINNTGQVLAQVEDQKGDPLFVTGHKTLTLEVYDKKTLYRSAGWTFPYLALIVFGIMFFKMGQGSRGRGHDN